MAYRLLVALIFTFGVFPFAVMYTFAFNYPDAHFAFDRETWAQGVFPIAVGWIVFLLPGMLPWLGKRYYRWVARKLGLIELSEQLKHVSERVRARYSAARAKVKSRKQPSVSPEAVFGTKIRNRQAGPTKPPTEMFRAMIDSLKTRFAEKRLASQDAAHKGNVGLLKAKETFERVRKNAVAQLTPDQKQKSIDLNSYTLSILSHISSIAVRTLTDPRLDPEDRDFCEAALSAIPKPTLIAVSEGEWKPPERSHLSHRETRSSNRLGRKKQSHAQGLNLRGGGSRRHRVGAVDCTLRCRSLLAA